MEKDILSEVIEVEREIQKCLEHEKSRAQEWLDKGKKESAGGFARVEQELAGAFGKVLTDAKHDAAVRAAEIVKDAEAQAARLRALDDGLLTRIAVNHLKRILPG